MARDENMRCSARTEKYKVYDGKNNAARTTKRGREVNT
jgi:hypothetical protein